MTTTKKKVRRKKKYIAPLKPGAAKKTRAKKATETILSITEVTVISGKTETTRVDIDDRKVSIPVAPEIKAYFNEQFFRTNPTDAQKKRMVTLMNIVRAAYRKGFKDGAK